MPGDLLYEEKLKILPAVNIGPVPGGRRVNIPFSGEVSGPTVRGKVEGVDYMLFRPDGLGVLDIHAVLTTDNNDLISVRVSGLATALPDARFNLKGAITYQTGSIELAWLNSTQGVVDGFIDMNRKEVTAKIFKV